jgi:hypothetical protein
MSNHNKIYSFYLVCILILLPALNTLAGNPGNSEIKPPSGLSIATFDVDATPPVGSYLTYNQMIASWDLGLRAKGIILTGAGQPIVVCSIDWIGIAGESQEVFRKAIADAAGTIPEKVAVHTVHQHDAPRSDFAAERLLKEAGVPTKDLDGSFAHELIKRLQTAVKNSLEKPRPVTHLGLGSAPVYQVASNRRILGPDGKVRATRYTTCQDPALRAEPEGVIDPILSLVSFWDGDQPVAVISFYATHPQSYYGTGIANPDFPGIARFTRQLAVPQALHIHFNGAGGNIGAGKYNDGSKENRGILASRVADGMKRAWEATKRDPVAAPDVKWMVEKVALPPAKYLETLNKKDTAVLRRNASEIAWLERCRAGAKIDVECLSLGKARILYMPGELFVEFQLAAKAKRPDLFVAMAAYGDYGPGYICTAKAYEQGGYEAGTASCVSPDAEKVLMSAIDKLLKN